MPSLSRSCCTSLVTSSSLSNREVRRRFHLHILAARKDLMHLTAWLNRDGVMSMGPSGWREKSVSIDITSSKWPWIAQSFDHNVTYVRNVQACGVRLFRVESGIFLFLFGP